VAFEAIGRCVRGDRKFHPNLLVLVREDKEKNMSSLFVRKRMTTPEMLTLPAFCVPAEESAKLEAKRRAQLEWMRETGVDYLLSQPVHRHAAAVEKRVA
jgi:hypothetical protein